MTCSGAGPTVPAVLACASLAWWMACVAWAASCSTANRPPEEDAPGGRVGAEPPISRMACWRFWLLSAPFDVWSFGVWLMSRFSSGEMGSLPTRRPPALRARSVLISTTALAAPTRVWFCSERTRTCTNRAWVSAEDRLAARTPCETTWRCLSSSTKCSMRSRLTKKASAVQLMRPLAISAKLIFGSAVCSLAISGCPALGAGSTGPALASCATFVSWAELGPTLAVPLWPPIWAAAAAAASGR